jgi:hypothetical protein
MERAFGLGLDADGAGPETELITGVASADVDRQ